MAKRKRLVPVQADRIEETAVRRTSRAPIADVAADVARAGAFDEVAQELASAREEGRLVLALPLETVQADHLIRDRLTFDPEDMAALRDSIRRRGQQTPIEVIELDRDGDVPRYGLIAGLRRLQVLEELAREEPDRFGTVKALVRRPRDAAEAYLAMVEENEIRAMLGFYEKAHLAVAAAEAGIFPDARAAVSTLFGSAPKAKRSKINSFVVLVEALGRRVRFPAQIPEHLGLKLVRRIREEDAFGQQLAADLEARPARTPEEERARLEAALQGRHKGNRERTEDGREVAPGIWMQERAGRARKAGQIRLSGPGVTTDLSADLQAWLASRA